MSSADSSHEEKEVPRSTPGQEDLHEANEPPFTAQSDDIERGNVPYEGGAALESVISAKPSVNNIKFVPNGGLTAWLQVLGSFFLFFNSWGIVNTFGVYQTFYETGILASSSPSAISWIGSIQGFLLMMVGSITGPIYDAGYVHHLLLTGSFLVVLGQMMLSLCTEYWQVMLAQGVTIGIGAGCLFVPAVAILSTYFSTHIALAMGIAAAGSSFGGVIYPIIFFNLYQEPGIGFPWATRVIGFIALATLIVSNAVMKVRVLPAGRRKFFDWTALTEVPYVTFVLGGFLSFIGLYAPFFYVQSYAIEEGIADKNLAFYFLAIINGLSVFGRIIPNFIADRVGPLNMIVPCAMISGVLAFCLVVARSIAGIIVILAFYGFFSGALVSLPPTIFVHLTANRGVIGTRMGMGFSVMSIGLLIGTPISGAILKATSFKYVWVFSGILVLAGTLSMFISKVTKGGPNLLKRV
ncbi:Hypothetical protein R9X50_00570300 [Acrodontium crateriforme]|uniref:Major facilitator superfamily (MFS) profile domain-containing protein n=1 Tax=Acrodontium crateriforme TaxID=150365 RepID=A0AAQ3RBQ3_9PEZI|nr:Hypothetical protein R9X50_00570300 [Acrodontium crateriforme]